MEKNIFSNLLRCRSNSDEDFLTELFAAVLREWNKSDPEGCHGFLKDKNLFNVAFGSDVRFDTQHYLPNHGRPDLYIESADALLIIENKWGAEVRDNQLANYIRFLNQVEKAEKGLILATVFPVDFEDIKQKVNCQVSRPLDSPFDHRYWHEIHSRLKEVLGNKRSQWKDRLVYLMETFLGFLKENGMDLQEVNDDLKGGVRCLSHLMKEIEQALENIASSGSIKWNCRGPWAGYDFRSPNGKDLKYWVGIFWSKPEELVFDVEDSPPQYREYLRKYLGSETPGGMPCTRRLFKEVGNFFGLETVEKQIQELKKFVNHCLERVDNALKTFNRSGGDSV